MTSAKRTCHKRRFANEFEAGKWLKRMQWHTRNQDGGVIPVRVYYHPECHGYHATHMPKDNDG
jgi:hypothetical protein